MDEQEDAHYGLMQNVVFTEKRTLELVLWHILYSYHYKITLWYNLCQIPHGNEF